jgi:hypothetical protein
MRSAWLQRALQPWTVLIPLGSHWHVHPGWSHHQVADSGCQAGCIVSRQGVRTVPGHWLWLLDTRGCADKARCARRFETVKTTCLYSDNPPYRKEFCGGTTCVLQGCLGLLKRRIPIEPRPFLRREAFSAIATAGAPRLHNSPPIEL